MSGEPAQGQGETDAAFEALCRETMRHALTDVAGAMARADELVVRAGASVRRRAWALLAQSHTRAYAGRFADALASLDDAPPLGDEAPGLGDQGPALGGGGAVPADATCVALLASARVQPLLRLGRAGDARDAAEVAVAHARRLNDALAVAKALVGLGAARRAAGDPHGAASALDEAQGLALSSADSATRATARAVAASAASNRGECLLDAERYDEALGCFEHAAAEFEALGRAHAVAIARGNAADVLGRLGRIDAAVPAFEAARRACEANGAHLDAARLSCEEAEMLWHAGALRAARDRYADALVPLEREGAGADLARARVALAGVLVELGDARSAAEIVKAASAGAGVGASSGARQDDATAFAASIVLARSALAVGDVARGRALVDAARGGADADLPARRARACLLSSRIALAEGDATRATEEARAALDAASATPLPGLIPDCHEALGVCALAMGEGAMAVRHLGLACDAAERAMEATASVAGHAGLVRRFAPMFVRHASLLLDAGATIEDAARAIVRAGLRALPRRAGGGMVRAGGGRGGGGRGGGGVAGVMAADADLRARLERVSTALDRATAAAGAFPRAEQARDIAGLLAHAAVLRERLATPESAVDGPDARAGEEARAGADAGRAALSGPEARSAEARGAEAAGQGVRDASRVCAAVARLARAHGTDAALLHWFVEEGAGGPWLSVLGAAARAEGAERSGEAGAGARDQPRLWIVRRVLTTADLASRVKRLAFLAERAATAVVGVGAAGAVQPAPEAWDLVLGRLARDVLAKALPDVAGTDAATPGLLVISGDRGVQPIPWMALARACWPGGAGGMGAAVPTRVVLEDLDRVLAAETGSDSAAAVRSSPRVCILAADDASIPGARAEALAVAAAWADARVVVGGTATVWLDAIRGEALPRTDQGHSSMATAPTILHIATHGVYVPDRPLASRLWCGDAWRTVGEIAAAIPSGAIVTLSVCHAGRAGGFAEDVAALPAALRAGGGVGAGGGGAACVVAPLWPLADATATRLFADIHAACARAYRAAASSLAASGAADEAKSPSDYPGSGRNLGIGGAVSVPALVASAVASMLGQGRVDTRWSIDGDGVVVNGAGP